MPDCENNSERRRAVDKELSDIKEWLADIEKRLTIGGTRFDELKRGLDANTEVTLEVRDIIISFKTFTKLLKWSTVVGAFLSSLGGLGLVIWNAWTKATGK